VACNIQNEFASIALGDRRRDERLLKFAARLAQSASGSVRAACQGWDETVAGYRLLHSEHLNMQKLLGAHRQALMQRASQCGGDLLLVQDTTELDYSTHKALRGSGPISDQSRRGFFLHNRLLVAEEAGLVLGICSAQTWARLDSEHGKRERRKSLPIEQKESMRWLEGYGDACALSAQFPERKIIMVADRECDIYELYVRWQERPQADFIVRACRDRTLLDEEKHLFEKLHTSPLLGCFKMEIARKEQTVKIKGNSQRRVREARLVRMEVRAMTVHPQPPQRKGLKLPKVELCAVLVAEQNPPEGQEPVEWLLLTTLSAQNFKGAMRIVRAYTRRWLVEEFHRVLKSGCRIEALTLRESGALLAAVALYMVVAWRILYLRDLSRGCAELPCTGFFTPAETRAACLILKRGADSDPPALGELTVMVAKIGGYAARKSDPPPGAECLWRGLEKLRCYVEMGQALGAL
jgi:hypothetical protein